MLNFSQTKNLPQSLIVTGVAGNNLSYAVLEKIKEFYQNDLISQRIDHGNFTDIKTIDSVGETIKVAEIREINHFLHMSAGEGDFKFVIINHADSMNQNAANSLLKILEEPPRNSYIFLLTFFPGQLLETIRSRCQIAKIDSLKEAEYDIIFDKTLLNERDFYQIDHEQFKDYYHNFVEAMLGDQKLMLFILDNLNKTNQQEWIFFKLAVKNIYMKSLKNYYNLTEEENLIRKISTKYNRNLPEEIERIFSLLQDTEEFYLDKRAVAINITYI